MKTKLSINNVWLNTYLKLVETGHFTKTAEALFMTQPGVSQHINKLEKQLDVVLLERVGKSFELTDAGNKIYKYGKQLASLERQAINSLHADDEFVGECKISCSGSLAMLIYKDCLARQVNNPDLRIHLNALPNQAITKQLLANEIDLGVVTQISDDPQLAYEKVGKEPLRLLIPSTLANNISFSELQKLGFINHPDGHHYASRLLSANFKDDFQSMNQFNETGFINQLTQILEPVALGLGFTVLPEYAVSQCAYSAKITRAQLTTPVTDTLYIVSKKHRHLPKRYQWFIEHIKGKTKA